MEYLISGNTDLVKIFAWTWRNVWISVQDAVWCYYRAAAVRHFKERFNIQKTVVANNNDEVLPKMVGFKIVD